MDDGLAPLDRRFIPTCVGNTSHGRIFSACRPVHPHVRGEHPRTELLPCAMNGSSPRAWGTRIRPNAPRVQVRFIPTCVGNTSLARLRNVLAAVHPHVRGEHLPHRVNMCSSCGSSPRAWGTRTSHRLRVEVGRFIPTCVGNTTDRSTAFHGKTVHPHVRGEHIATELTQAAAGGSSPRAWGTRHGSPCPCGNIRFIPTCVGNT